MNIIQKLFALFGADYAVLISHDRYHYVRRVRWLCGVPFAAPHLPETAARLLPEGKLNGRCYLESWLPATPRMQRYFDSPNNRDEQRHE
jgi:hypothetical protein